MNRFTLMVLGLLLGILALSIACGPGAGGAASNPVPTKAAAAPFGDATKGKTLFAGTCASCHGPDAKGLPNLGKDLTTSAFAKGLSDEDLLKFILKGRPASDPANTTGVDMPPRGGNPALKDADLKDIIAYVRTLEK